MLNIDVQLVSYDAPKIFFVGAERREVRQAVEITVQTAAPIPARALSPVLFVGNAEVVEMEALGRNRYKFYALEPARLEQGAAIAFGWPGQAAGSRDDGTALAQRTVTSFRYRLAGGRGVA
ncbi:MAG TPA: hypothetical protein VF516_06010 [Kofleriaceae bacterium]